MEYQYKCVNDLKLPWYDEEERITENYGTVRKGSVWELGTHRGEQPIRLHLRAGESDFSYIDISVETLRVNFKMIEGVQQWEFVQNAGTATAGHTTGGQWYCNSPKVSIFKPPVDFSECFEPRGKHGADQIKHKEREYV